MSVLVVPSRDSRTSSPMTGGSARRTERGPTGVAGSHLQTEFSLDADSGLPRTRLERNRLRVKASWYVTHRELGIRELARYAQARLGAWEFD